MKKILPVLLLAAASSCAQAETWTFTYQGFHHSGAFDPDYRLQGSFTGLDHDSNGVIDLVELTVMEVEGGDYIGPGNGSGVEYYLDSFSYALTGALQFSTRYYYSDGILRLAGSIISGDRIRVESNHTGTGEDFLRNYYWTDQTTFAISPPPVPEPSTYAMLGLGALLVGARLRVKRAAR